MLKCDKSLIILWLQVWEFPVSVIFIVDMLVLTSNAVALKGQNLWICLRLCIDLSTLYLTCCFVFVYLLTILLVMTESATSRCLAVCFIAHSIRFLVDQISGHLGSVM